MLHPDIENLVFAGRASTFLSIVTFSVQARWIAELLAGRVALPDRQAMLDEIALMKAWKRSWMPFSSARSARVLLHMANYHAELGERDKALSQYSALLAASLQSPYDKLVRAYSKNGYRTPNEYEWASSAPLLRVCN